MPKNNIFRFFSVALLSGVLTFGDYSFVNFLKINEAEAAVSSWQKGASMVPSWTGDFETESFRRSVNNAHSAGVTTLVLIVPMYQADIHSSDIYAGWNTPTDSSLTSATNHAKSLGMQVVYKLHVDPSNGDWRANINAWDRDAWYRSYGNALNHLGDLAKQNGVQGIVIGTEMISMATFTSNGDNTARWNKMISDLRQRFSGFLTYSANWGGSDYAEEVPDIGFWSSLDYIGISAYYPLAEGASNPSQDALKGSWNYWENAKIKAIHDQVGKPVLFTEIGYRSVDNAHNLPWYAGPSGGYNAAEQVNDYEALLSYWNDRSYMQGMYVWDWNTNPDYGGAGNTDFTPQHKPAQDTLARWFGSPTPPTDPENPPPSGGSSVSGDWNISSQAPSLSAGQSANIPVSIGISGQATNVVIDAEIYNSSGNQIYQKFFTGQNISPQARNFTLDWTPPSNGSYTLKIGIFNQDWSNLYIWNDSVTTLNVGGGTGPGTPPPSGPATLDIWWPTDGSTISGVQPFKGLVQNRSLSEYRMYWQVDNGGLVEMYDSQQDYPHKEAYVDVGPWSWRDGGPYELNFVAKDSGGNTIAERKSRITVVR